MKIFFGDNQFLGVNHSQGKGDEYYNKYNDVDEIAKTLIHAWDAGIRDFCFTVDKKTTDAINLIIEDYPFNLHPAIPYAHSVNEKLAAYGLTKAILNTIKDVGFFEILRAAIFLFFKNYVYAFKVLIYSEICNLPLKNIKSIGLLNIASDFLLGIRRYDLLKSFDECVKLKFKKKTFFYTNNFPNFADVVWNQQNQDSSIVFNYNELGFRTNPSLIEVKDAIKSHKKKDMIAMSLFSGGKKENIGDLLRNSNIKGVLFGSSNQDRIKENYKLFKEIS